MLIELRKVKSGSTLILISDFLGVDESTSGLLQALVSQHEVNAIWIHDQTETDEWKPGTYPVQIEIQSIALDTSQPLVADLLLQQQQNHRHKVESLMGQFNIPLHSISCNEAITTQLYSILKN